MQIAGAMTCFLTHPMPSTLSTGSPPPLLSAFSLYEKIKPFFGLYEYIKRSTRENSPLLWDHPNSAVQAFIHGRDYLTKAEERICPLPLPAQMCEMQTCDELWHLLSALRILSGRGLGFEG
jgi:hypothetical protein